MIIGPLQINHEPGATYADPPFGEQRTAEEAARDRAEKRIGAIDQFKRTAAATTRGQMEPLVTQLIAMCIQLRALGGSGVETNIPNKLREAADFLEDL